MSGKIHNTINSTIGGLKQHLGHVIGNENLEAKDAAQKAQAEAAQHEAAQHASEAKTHTHKSANKTGSGVQTTVDPITGDKSLETQGHTSSAPSDTQRSV